MLRNPFRSSTVGPPVERLEKGYHFFLYSILVGEFSPKKVGNRDVMEFGTPQT